VISDDLGWDYIYEDSEEEFDIFWSDLPISNQKFLDLETYQKTNHFPGMIQICRKNLLAKNLNAMQKLFPDDYNFYPKTWILPQEIENFRL
jgi:tubulin polyglutamylase TTLL6/13